MIKFTDTIALLLVVSIDWLLSEMIGNIDLDSSKDVSFFPLFLGKFFCYFVPLIFIPKDSKTLIPKHLSYSILIGTVISFLYSAWFDSLFLLSATKETMIKFWLYSELYLMAYFVTFYFCVAYSFRLIYAFYTNIAATKNLK